MAGKDQGSFDVNLERLVTSISTKINVLTPIIEGIVNAIDSINERKKVDSTFGKGEILVEISQIASLLKEEEESGQIGKIEITDNGIGFIEGNCKSFKQLFSDRKIDIGGKGFGRITYLKYFNDVQIESHYKDDNGNGFRTFKFGKKGVYGESNDDSFIKNKTTISLCSPSAQFCKQLNTKIETLSRKLSEHLLSFLLNEDCPVIKLSIKGHGKTQIQILNEYIHSPETKIVQQGFKKFPIDEQEFEMYVFKFYYPESQKSSINLVAHNRVVTSIGLEKYIPEFKEEFYDESEKKSGKGTKNENYVIKVYVKGKYLDECVNNERSHFSFPTISKGDTFYILTSDDIEKESVENAKEFFPENLKERKNKKIEKVNSVVIENFPWHKTLLKEGTDEEHINNLPYSPSDEDIDLYFEKIRFKKEGKVRSIARKIMSGDFINDDINEKTQEVIDELAELNTSELAHYVCLRKIVLELYDKHISYSGDEKYYKEEKIHNLIFPMGESDKTLGYDEHHLWVIDETLAFSKLIFSDNAIKAEDGRRTEPDILIFREGYEKHSPVYIIELKRPGRKDYPDDAIKQLANYADRLRKNNEVTIKGRPINVTATTPIYGYFVCDITKKVKESIDDWDGIELLENEAYYGYHKKKNMYWYVYSFDFLLKNAEQRNKIFFDRLGL